MVNDKPEGSNWINPLATLDDWNIDSFYTFSNGINGILHDNKYGGKVHDYAWTKTK